MKEVTLHQQEQARLHVLNSVLAEEITIGQAAALMDLSERHARRLLAAYRERGAEALAHGNRGRRPHNAVPEAVAAAVVRLAAERYPGANHTHLTELLEEQEGIALSRPTLRRILTRAGIPSPRRRRPPEHRVRRERMPRAGMLLQVDGSHHAWLEQRAPRFALLLAVDDATGSVAHALFRPAEDARGYFLLMEGVFRRSGIPLALYSDRHGVFRAPAQQRAGREGATQFARAMAELGVRLIFARSPQAKGRVERVAGTFQDRLVTELRLAGATTIAGAQAVLERFLPRFNARFAVAAREPEPAWRSLDPALDLGAVLAFRDVRTVARDNTVKYHWRTLQLLPGPERTSYAGARVEMLERPGGELAVRHQEETIPSRLAPPRAGVLREPRSVLARDPALERIAQGLGPSGGPPGAPEPAAAANGTAANGASPQAGVKPLRPPTPRQQARWKAIQQAQLQGLSMRATASLLGISHPHCLAVVGDCFNDPNAGTTEVADVGAVSCAEPHDNEVYAIADHPAGDDAPFPGVSALSSYSRDYCLGEFDRYVGISYNDSRLDVAYFYPTAAGWEDHEDRQSVCFLFDAELRRLSGSMQGSRE